MIYKSPEAEEKHIYYVYGRQLPSSLPGWYIEIACLLHLKNFTTSILPKENWEKENGIGSVCIAAVWVSASLGMQLLQGCEGDAVLTWTRLLTKGSHQGDLDHCQN